MTSIVLSFRQLCLKSLIPPNPWMELKEASLSHRRIIPLTHSCTVPLATNIPPLVSMGLFYKMMKVGYLRNKLCLVCIKAPQSSSGDLLRLEMFLTPFEMESTMLILPVP